MEPKFTSHAQRNHQKYSGEHLPYNRELVEIARTLRKKMTVEERILWKAMHALPVRILRQRPIDNYVVDFYIASAGLVIEIDGGQHYQEEYRRRDDARTARLESLGLRVIRFSNREIRDNLIGVMLLIAEVCGL